mgnify:CR=1 FL=1
MSTAKRFVALLIKGAASRMYSANRNEKKKPTVARMDSEPRSGKIATKKMRRRRSKTSNQ